MKRIIAALLAIVTVGAVASPSGDTKMYKIADGFRKNTMNIVKNFPVGGDPDGLYGFIKANQLVITHAEGSCSFARAGMCQIDAYITRATYRKVTISDPGAFCGVLLRWETPESDMRKWTPVSGLAMYLADGRRLAGLQVIDDKNKSFCER